MHADAGGLKRLHLALLNKTGKMLKRAVIGRFRLCGKAAPGKLAAFEVIADAFAANPFPGAGRIGTRTGFEVFFLFALHFVLLTLLFSMGRG